MINLLSPANRRQSVGYLLSLTSACVGLPFLGIGFGGTVIAWSGGDPSHAFRIIGMVTFLLAYAVMFAMRLLFWPRTPPLLKMVIRTTMITLFSTGAIVAGVGVVLALRLPEIVIHRVVPIIFSCLALTFQPGALIWVLRYRNEGL